MSKLSFRAKALDPGKPMPVYIGDEIPDLPDFSAVNRTVPEMPTGMEKEEETEHHLQRALSAQQVYGTAELLVIPIPDMDFVEDRYKKLYCSGGPFKLPKQYIHVQRMYSNNMFNMEQQVAAWGMDQEIPEYDMDSEDEQWLMHQVKNLKMDVKPIKFENMMDRLEKGSGQMVVTLSEAKALLKEDDDLTMSVYDYWLNKRLRLQHSLIPQVKTEKRDGTSTSNPYVAFRRRAEKMQTRKNRKNDETSYEKMLKLRKDLSRTLLILEMLKRREKSKKELLKLTTEVAEKRYQLQDWDGKLLEEANAKKDLLPVFQPVPLHFSTKRDWMTVTKEDGMNVCKKREYKKRKHKTTVAPVERITKQHHQQQQQQPTLLMHRPLLDPLDSRLGQGIGTDDEGILSGSSPSDHDGDSDPDGIYSFRRKPGCAYHAPCHVKAGQSPWGSQEQVGFGEKKYKYCLTSLGRMQNCLGYTRRRLGRGGRVIFDRAFTLWDKCLRSVNWSSQNSPLTSDYYNHLTLNNIPHFQPISSCHLNDTLSGSREVFPSVLPPLGLSAAPVAPQSLDAVGHSDHPYFASIVCDSEHQQQQPAAGNGALLMPINCDPSVAATKVAALLTVNDASDCSSNGSHLTSASAKGHRSQEPAQGSDKFPVISAVCSQSSGNNAGLSTLPAESILQLNFPLANSPRHTTSSMCNVLQPLMSSRCSLQTQASTNHCRIIKSVISRTGALSIQQLTNNAHKVTTNFLRPELTRVNHANLPAFATNTVSSPVGATMTSPNHTDHSLLVPVLKLPGTTANRSDKSKETLESLNHIAKESVVGVEVT